MIFCRICDVLKHYEKNPAVSSEKQPSSSKPIGFLKRLAKGNKATELPPRDEKREYEAEETDENLFEDDRKTDDAV